MSAPAPDTGTPSRLRIGIDLGGTKTEGIVMAADGGILTRLRRPTPQQQGYDAVLENIRELVRALEQAAGGPCRVGIGTPGAISTRSGLLKNSNTVCLNGRPVQQDLQALLQRELRIANDANCFALSEARDGAAAGAAVVFGVILGTGVGGGIVVRGQLVEGAQHIAGEWGHNVLEPDGPACYCGRRGCVETFLSGPGLLRDYRSHGGEAAIDTHEIVARAVTGDVRATAAMQRYLARFGRALATVINILDPDVVVLGGGMSSLDALYGEGIKHLARHVFDAVGPAAGPEDLADAVATLRQRVCRNRHGDSSGVRGAAQLWNAAE